MATGHSQGYAASLAARSNPTVLFEGSPQRSLVAFSYGSGLFLNGAAAVNVWFNVFNTPAGFPEVATYAFTGAAVMMSILGTKFALTPASVVRSISVLPAKQSRGGSSATGPSPVQLEVRARGLFPGMPLKRMVVSPADLVLHTRLQPPKPASETAAERLEREQREREEAAARREYEINHLMTAPFRHFAWAIKTIFQGARRSLTGEGFAHVEIQKKTYKLDVTNAYALEDGRALDRIARIKADEPAA